MKKFFKLLFAFSLGLAMAGCAKYDDTELRGKVDNLTSEVNTLKANQQAMQAVIDVWKAGGYVASIDNSVPGQHTITFYGDNGKTVVLYDGEDGDDGDAFFKDVTSDENGVTFEKQDGTKIFIPFAKAFKLVIENPEAEVEAGAKVEFAYKVENANSTTSVDVFASGNYAAVVDAEASKIGVTAPTPAVNGSVLAWAQNEEGLFSMRKLSFFVKAETTVVTEEEEYQAISGDAGNFVIGLVSNVDVEIEKPTVDWITVVPDTKVAVTHKLTLALAENTTGEPREATINILRSDNKKQVQSIKIVQLKKKALTIKNVFAKNSTDSEAWNAYYGGTGGTDRNIAMDDEYVYIAESAATAKLWAISVADPNQVKAVNVEGVAGGTHVLTCPRVVKNTDANVNGGKDVLICSNLTRGGEDPKLYMWVNGIDNAPKAITLTTYATASWYGDTFTVWGTLQDGVLLFDKTNTGGNGVVTFILKGVPTSDQMYLVGRAKTVEAFGSHDGVCALYLFPDGAAGVYSPGRGAEKRGQIATLGSSVKSEGGIAVTLSPLDYDEGTNAFVLGYNFIEWEGNRYVIYGNYVSNKKGYVRVRQGALTDDWSKVASTGTRLYRRDLESGGLTAANSAMDITARVIDGELYIAAQMQNVGFGLYKLCYE